MVRSALCCHLFGRPVPRVGCSVRMHATQITSLFSRPLFCLSSDSDEVIPSGPLYNLIS